MFTEPQPLDRKILDCSQGVARTFTRRIYGEDAYAISGFTGKEILSVEISTGFSGVDTRQDPTATWSQPSEGEYQIQIPELNATPGIDKSPARPKQRGMLPISSRNLSRVYPNQSIAHKRAGR